MFSSIESRVGFKYKIEIKSTAPWIVVVDNFLTELEIEKLTGGLNSWEVFPKNAADKNQFSGEYIVCQQECRNVSYKYDFMYDPFKLQISTCFHALC